MRPTSGIKHISAATILTISALYLSACNREPAPTERKPDIEETSIIAVESSTSFVVIGDTPYSKADRDMLALAVPKIKAANMPFVIHIGDYKGGGQECTPSHDDGFADLVENLKPVPVFYTPGDNEWVDCDRFKHESSGKYYSEYDRLALIKKRFFASPAAMADSLSYTQQSVGKVNAAWVQDNVRFATLHWTGTANGRKWIAGDDPQVAKPQIEAREAANMDWLKIQFELASNAENAALILAVHADVTDVDKADIDKTCEIVSANGDLPCDAFANFRKALSAHAKAFTGPVLVIHGDTSPFTLNQTFLNDGAPNLWRLNAAGDAGIGRTGQKYGTIDVTLVGVSPEAAVPFSASGLMTGKVAKVK